MRPLNELNHLRRVDWEMQMVGMIGDDNYGYFALRSPVDNKILRLLISVDAEWEHLSISRHDRCPNWDEMSFAFSTFFKPDETAMQVHVPEGEHISNHPYCLHIWRPVGVNIPKPPAHYVGIKGASEDEVKGMVAARKRGASKLARSIRSRL